MDRGPLWARSRAAPGRKGLTVAWPAGPFWSIVERDLALMSCPFLAFAIRSYAPRSSDPIDPVEAKLAALATSPLASRLVFTTPDALVAEVGS